MFLQRVGNARSHRARSWIGPAVALFFLAFLLATAADITFAHNPEKDVPPADSGAGSDSGEEVEIEGTLAVFHEDWDTGGRFLYSLSTDQGEELSLDGVSEAQNLQTGDRVRVKGLRLGKTVKLKAGGGVQTVALAPSSGTFGAQRTLVILVNFEDYPVQAYTVDYARGVVFTTTSNFFKENSFNQTWLTGDVVGWYTIPVSRSSCNASAIASNARSKAEAAGVNLANYSRFVYGFPSNACSWWGLATVGGNPSHAWINGSFQLRVVGHELGHNLGLYHSHALDCGSAVIGGSCSSIEYGDTVDIMGSSAGHFNAFQKEYLGWLGYGASPPITTVQSAGTYTLDPYAAPANGNPKALKILKSSGTWYYVEFRRPVGFDAFVSSYPGVTNGVVIHTGSDWGANSSYLLDMTPETGSWWDPALAVGKSYTDPNAGVTITSLWANSTNAGVAVSFGSGGSTTCVRANPTVTATPYQSPGVAAGSTVNYSVTVKNNDSTGCSSTSFTPQANVPSGWTAATLASLAALNPGSTASWTLQVTSPSSASVGGYPIGVLVINDAATNYAGTTTVVYTVANVSNGVEVTTDKASYESGQTVAITTSVRVNGGPVSGATVTIQVVRPDGRVARQTTPRTGADGTARNTYRPNQAGTWEVRAVASANGVVIGSDTTTFEVVAGSRGR
jgi:hypothetical protein